MTTRLSFQPSPLFQKIDASVADQFRAKYGGNKQNQQTQGAKSANAVNGNTTDTDVAALQAEITKQARHIEVTSYASFQN